MLQITAIPAFSDNYQWLLEEADTAFAWVVDPGDANSILQVLKKKQKSLKAILITHHHWDHVDGIAKLLAHYPNIPVFGPQQESIAGLNRPLQQGEQVQLPESQQVFTVLDTPGHTLGHITYYTPGLLFCGDTLFACGCGRVFEGTMAQMQQSLAKLRDLPDETLVYCAHEYTLDNIGFAKWVEPDNADLLTREISVQEQRKQGKATVPSLLSLEKQTNPFLRFDKSSVIQAAESYAGKALNRPAEVFAALRQWKDREYD
ncbi:hydroxyacylglutathione hydrolase [Candidatus Venteria ishoeyi]|uniref:Hydroxyacylglutathione hydrolase n=1 Tax=Candidatus Venteria ishoeyi TaxID=1899563 RepID=A0A1H6FA40_9GAMM|nr:hydroxyacylglutathione hydrolase [Candidatus Venteria ishoeyi]SEH06169.1 Hydroxyacylglutathione hydrolase [Candidatus Venteria ishoeyi]